ncbi:endocuticle structural glycoprotein SgAbd-1-like [Periplaneta americana]|uniref:endocuticle structural glycoprotein SgAbd-1-like n=1 Tax=Periplaneta americana TaxID=6978 RepID=UPI0037E86870
MFRLVLVASVVVAVLGAPPKSYNSGNEIPIISQETEVNGDGSFKYSYESGDGTRVQESGALKALGPKEEGEAVQGSFSFVAPDGTSYSVVYTADENGFVPQAPHLPVAPPIPEAIQRSIEYNLAHPEEDKSQK